MKVYFRRSQYFILFLLAIFIVTAMFFFLEKEALYMKFYFLPYLIWGVGAYIIHRRTYLELTDISIVYRRIQPIEIRFDELTEVNFYAGEYIMKSGEKTIMIYRASVSKKYRDDVDEIFNRVKFEYEKNNSCENLVSS